MTDSVGNRFGEIVVREGYASRTAVQVCLAIQEKLRSFGVEPKRIGEIMVEKKFLTDNDVDEILGLQKNPASRVDISNSRLREVSQDDEFAPPKTLAGYEIGELLGRGGMGAVYKARQTSLDRTVAIKILPPRTAKNRSFIERFISEARTVAKLNHKNIIAGIDVGEDKGFYYFVMEFVEGESLDKVIEREGTLEESYALEVMVQMARALEHATKHNLVHRDIKPQNILIDDADQAKLCDLGLAQTRDDISNQSKSGETRNAPLGTPHYLSPEQAKGLSNLDIRSDIYSLGATFFHMVTGRPPFEGQSPMVLMTKHLTEDPPNPRKLNSSVSKATGELILAMLEKEPDDRPQDPEELMRDLERVMSGKKPRVGSKGSRRQRRAERVGSGSRRRHSESPSRGPAHDEPKRRRRAATIRQVRKTENTFLTIFIVTVVLLVGVFLFLILKPPVVKTATIAPPEVQEQANAELQTARMHENQGYANRARDVYRSIIAKYPGTNAADFARQRLREMR